MTKEITNEDLARMVQDGFADVGSRLDKLERSVDERFREVDKRFDSVEKRLETIENVISEDVLARVRRLEEAVGIK